MKTVIRRLRNKGRARKNTQAPTRARKNTQPLVHSCGWKQPGLRARQENFSFRGSLSPSHQSGPLANVTQLHVWRQWVFLPSVPAASPKTEKNKTKQKTTLIGPLFSLLSLLQFLLFGALFKIHDTHKPCSESHLQHASLKNKK